MSKDALGKNSPSNHGDTNDLPADDIVVTARLINSHDTSGGNLGAIWGISFDLNGANLLNGPSIFGSLSAVLPTLINQDSDGDGTPDISDPDGPPIIEITASPEQVAAAKSAYSQAYSEMVFHGATFASFTHELGIGEWLLNRGGGLVAGGAFVAGSLDVFSVATNALADKLYWDDFNQDGRWDGYVYPDPDGDYTPRMPYQQMVNFDNTVAFENVIAV